MRAGEPIRPGPGEDAVLHAICFLMLGPLLAFVFHAGLSALFSVPTIGWARAARAGADGFSLLGSIYAVLAFVVIGPAMLVTGAIVSLASRGLIPERWIEVAGFCIAAGVAIIFIPITGRSDSRLPLPWDNPAAMIASGGAGLVMTRFTRFLRRWRNRPPEASGSRAL